MHFPRVILAGLIAATAQIVAAQPGREAPSPGPGWPNNYEPNINHEGITRADRVYATARLAEIERIFHRIPELSSPTEFVVRRQFWGGARPVWMSNGTAAYTLFIWFFARFGPAREIAREGCKCIAVTINAYEQSHYWDEHGRPIFIEPDVGDGIPGATVVYGQPPSDDRPVSASVTFTRGGEFPFEPLSREEYLRALIVTAEGNQGEKAAAVRKAFEKTPYELWMEGAEQRRTDREALAAQLKGIHPPEKIAEQMASLEATERDVTEGLKAKDAEERKRNQEFLAKPMYGDELRARIEAMSPEERRQVAMVENNWELLPLGAPGGHRVLRPKVAFWQVRRSPVEIHSITVSMAGSTGGEEASRTAVIRAIQQTYRNLDWAALKRMVDAFR